MSELVYTYTKDFYLGYVKDDLLAMLEPFFAGVNGQELKTIIDSYITQIAGGENFAFSGLQEFLTSIKDIIGDGMISLQELESAREFLNK